MVYIHLALGSRILCFRTRHHSYAYRCHRLPSLPTHSLPTSLHATRVTQARRGRVVLTGPSIESEPDAHPRSPTTYREDTTPLQSLGRRLRAHICLAGLDSAHTHVANAALTLEDVAPFVYIGTSQSCMSYHFTNVISTATVLALSSARAIVGPRATSSAKPTSDETHNVHSIFDAFLCRTCPTPLLSSLHSSTSVTLSAYHPHGIFFIVVNMPLLLA